MNVFVNWKKYIVKLYKAMVYGSACIDSPYTIKIHIYLTNAMYENPPSRHTFPGSCRVNRCWQYAGKTPESGHNPENISMLLILGLTLWDWHHGGQVIARPATYGMMAPQSGSHH